MNAEQVFSLAEQCGVAMNAACKRSGVSGSTPYRWQKKGQTADPATVKRLRDAVLVIALERGTLPERYEQEARDLLAQEVKRNRQPADIIREMKGNLKELDKALGA